MATVIDSAESEDPRPGELTTRRRPVRPAQAAAARVWRAGLGLGLFGLASCGLVLVRLFESWRVEPHLAGHRISVLGVGLSYPAANVWAILIVALALLGLLAATALIIGAAGEMAVTRRFTRDLARRSPSGLGSALVIDEPQPTAFCAGLLRPRVFVSSAAVELLDDGALTAVLAHELHHARRRDPLRLAAGRVLARALFFVPGLAELARRQRALAELSADEAAIGGDDSKRPALARAMLSFTDTGAPGAGIDPARVDHLLGEPPSWRFPAFLCLGAAGVIALFFAVALLIGGVASGTATLALPLLSKQPCVVVLALTPATLWLLAAQLRRGLRPRDA
jgi:hypothetical protein